MIIGIDFDEVVAHVSREYGDYMAAPRKGIQEFINSLKDNYKILIYSVFAENEEDFVIVQKTLQDFDIYYDFINNNYAAADIYISSKAIQFSGDFNDLKFAILRYRKQVHPDYSFSPGDYGKLYYRLSMLPKGTILKLLKEYGYHPILKNKLVLVEFALNVLPSKAFNSIWKKEFQVSSGSNHELFAEAWNSVKPKVRSKRRKIYE